MGNKEKGKSASKLQSASPQKQQSLININNERKRPQKFSNFSGLFRKAESSAEKDRIKQQLATMASNKLLNDILHTFEEDQERYGLLGPEIFKKVR